MIRVAILVLTAALGAMLTHAWVMSDGKTAFHMGQASVVGIVIGILITLEWLNKGGPSNG